MQLIPRYDGPNVLHIDLPIGDPSVPLLRQRRRMAETLGGLDDEQWAAPSRCEGWSVQDVVAHLVGTNGFWAASMNGGLAGSPTRFLATFDPVATPAALVEPMRGLAPREVLDRYVQSLDGLADALTDVPAEAWSSVLAEAPQGHIELQAVALHALWDAWTHERDIMLPLGLQPEGEVDEIAASLVYAAAISPALLAAGGETRTAVLAVDATSPDVSFVVETGPVVTVRERRAGEPAQAELRGEAVNLIEGLTFRAPLVHDVAPEHQWVLGGLAEAFDIAG